MDVSTVAVRPPFRLDLTVAVLRRLPSNVVDVFDGTTYRRALGDPRDPSLVAVRQVRADRVEVRVGGPLARRLDHQVWVERVLGTACDLTPFERAADRIGWLAPLVAGARGVKPPRYPTLWEACVNAIVYQQISIHAAGAILRRTVERYAAPVEVGELRLFVFPSAATFAAADPEELHGVGLSLHKIVALRAVARALADGELDEAGLRALPTADLTAALTAHRGIGPWTAAIVALRGFGRLDLFPMSDSGAAKGLRELGGSDVDVAALLAALGEQRGMLYYHLLLGRLAARGELELAATPIGS